MDNQLLALRDASYAAGLKHDQALIACTDVLISGDYNEAEAAASDHQKIADEYGKALLRLQEHLSKLEQTPEVTEEQKRVHKLLELLDSEVETVTHRLELLQKHHQ